MEEKESYTLDEAAQFCEAYRRASERGSSDSEEIGKYKKFVPKSIQKAVRDLRDVEWGFYSNENKEREATKDSDVFKRFEEFFKVFN